MRAGLGLDVNDARVSYGHHDCVRPALGVVPAFAQREGLRGRLGVEVFGKEADLGQRHVEGREMVAVEPLVPLHDTLAKERGPERGVVRLQPRGVDLGVGRIARVACSERAQLRRVDDATRGALRFGLGEGPHGKKRLRSGRKGKPRVHGKHARKRVVVGPLGALLRSRGHEANGQDFHAVGVEQVAVGHGGGRGVVDVSNFELRADFRLGGRAHCVGRDRNDGHGCSWIEITWRLLACRFRL